MITKQLVINRDDAVEFIEDLIDDVKSDIFFDHNIILQITTSDFSEVQDMKPKYREYYRGKVEMIVEIETMFDVYINKLSHGFLSRLHNALDT